MALGTKAGAELPLIGVTTSEIRRKDAVRPTPEGEPAQVELALGLEYVQAIEAAGAIPVVLPPLLPEVVAPLLLRLSGVCLSGGPDLDPAAYGGPQHPRLGPTEPAVDRFELEVARLAWRLGMPVLAICRGAQALNVSRGGVAGPAPARGGRCAARASPGRACAARDP